MIRLTYYLIIINVINFITIILHYHSENSFVFGRLESYECNDNFTNDPVILPPSVMPDWPDGGFRQLQQAHHHLMPAILEGHVVGYRQLG